MKNIMKNISFVDLIIVIGIVVALFIGIATSKPLILCSLQSKSLINSVLTSRLDFGTSILSSPDKNLPVIDSGVFIKSSTLPCATIFVNYILHIFSFILYFVNYI